MKITTEGLDLAKTVIQVHGVDGSGKVVLKKPLKREQVLGFFATLPRVSGRAIPRDQTATMARPTAISSTLVGALDAYDGILSMRTPVTIPSLAKAIMKVP